MQPVGKLVKDDGRVKTYIVEQSKLTSDCWLIQIQGIEACDNCELLNTRECGGQEIRKGKNNVNSV